MQDRTALAQQIADAAAAELGDAFSAEGDGEISTQLQSAVSAIEPPSGVVQVRPSGSSHSRVESGFAQASMAVVVVPKDGDNYCVLIAVASDGSTAGIAAEGEASDSCRNATPWTPTNDPLLADW